MIPQAEPLMEAVGFEPLPLCFRSMDVPVPAPAAEPVILPSPAPAIDLETIARAAREQGLQEGIARTEAVLQSRVEQERRSVGDAVEGFLRDKQRYFAGLEKEVVRLSLAIAERVLHRESAMDPMLLAGAARVALEQVKDEGAAVLRVAPDELGEWSYLMESEHRDVRVLADNTLRKGECMLETASGTVELGMRAQLQEIEHGFFEILGRNPAMAV